MTSPIDDVFRKILNDRAIFNYGKDDVGRLFSRQEVPKLRELLGTNALPDFKNEVQRAKERQERQKRQIPRDKRPPRELEQSIELAHALREKLETSLPLVRRIFDLLDDYGALQCQLPNMEDYGKVVENQPRSAVEQFFAYQIGKASERQREPLRRMLNYVEEGYQKGLRPEELGFLVRKVENLKRLTEV